MSAKSSANKSLNLFSFIPRLIQGIPKVPNLVKDGIATLLMTDDDQKSIGHFLEENAVKYTNRPAIYFEDTVLSHINFNDITNQYARYFQSVGVKYGHVVVVFLENRVETLLITAALAKIGAIASLINSNQRSKVLLHSINMRNDGFFAVGVELIDAFEDIRNEIIAPKELFLMGVTDKNYLALPEEYADVKMEVGYQSARNLPETRKMKAKTAFAYIFTSGTTGMPKASIQTHRKWLTCVNWFGRINIDLQKTDVIYISIPFFHSNALLVGWSCAAANGAAMAIRRKFSASAFWSDIVKYNASAFVYIGDICRYLHNTAPSDKDQQHRVSKIVGNGLRPDIWESFKTRFGIKEVYEFYASSEGNLSFTNTLNLDATVGWCVSPFAVVEYDIEEETPIRFKDGFMRKVNVGDVGLMLSEINDRFPFPGYVNEGENDKKIFRDVFVKGDVYFNTGDLMRDLGFLHAQFVDRLGDTFRWKGENVATAEVEESINAFPNVATSAVYGVSIPKTDGRAGMAAIQLCDENQPFDWESFAQHLKKELPNYATPLFVRIQQDFEWTSTFKIKKVPLKKEGFQLENDNIEIRYWNTFQQEYLPLDKAVVAAILKGETQQYFR